MIDNQPPFFFLKTVPAGFVNIDIPANIFPFADHLPLSFQEVRIAGPNETAFCVYLDKTNQEILAFARGTGGFQSATPFVGINPTKWGDRSRCRTFGCDCGPTTNVMECPFTIS